MGRSLRFLGLGALLLGAACDAEEPRVRGEPQEPEPEPEPTGRSVVGLRQLEWRYAAGKLLDPADLDGAVVQAHCPDGEGGWTIFPGHGEPDGSFAIHGLPEGHCWIRVDRWEGGEEMPQDEYFWTDAATLDFGTVKDERPQVEFPQQPTRFTVAADGLEPWVEGEHEIGLVVPNLAWAQYNVADFEGTVEGVPADGATSTDALWYDFANLSAPVLDEEKGDSAFLIQSALRETAEGNGYFASLRASEPQPVSLADGGSVEIEATLQPLEQHTYRLHWDIPAFDALAGGMHEGATPFARGFAHLSALGVEEDGWNFGSRAWATFVLADESVFETTDAVDFGEVEFGNPLPGGTLFDWYQVWYAVQLPWLFDTEQEIWLTVGQYGGEAPTAEQGARPLVSPVRNIRINGQDASTPLEGVGLQPRISWDAPETGAVTSYEVRLVVPSPGDMGLGGYFVGAARLVVPGDVTEIDVPFDLLREEIPYAVLVRAIASEGQDVRTAPLARSLPYAWAEAISEPFLP